MNEQKLLAAIMIASPIFSHAQQTQLPQCDAATRPFVAGIAPAIVKNDVEKAKELARQAVRAAAACAIASSTKDIRS